MIKTIDRFQAFFIHSCETEDRSRPIEGTPFLEQMVKIGRDEFSDAFIKSTKRKTLFSGPALFDDHDIRLEIYASIFDEFAPSIVYTRLCGSTPIDLARFSSLCSGNKYLDRVSCRERPIRQLLAELSVENRSRENAFLILQVQAASPDYDREDNRDAQILDVFDGAIEQLLLRSDTHPGDLRPNNHSSTHENISNFYGSVDFCSKNTLIQIYLHRVRNLSNPRLVIDEDYRICWWLALIDIVHLQRSVLRRSETRVDDVLDFNTGERVVHQINEIDKIVRDMKRYWSLDEMTHPMSRVVITNLRSRMGLDERLQRVYGKMEKSEQIITRSLEQSRNRQAALLNYLVLLLAGIELFPLVREGVYRLGVEAAPVVFAMSAGVALLPIALFAYVGALRRRSRRKPSTP